MAAYMPWRSHYRTPSAASGYMSGVAQAYCTSHVQEPNSKITQSVLRSLDLFEVKVTAEDEACCHANYCTGCLDQLWTISSTTTQPDSTVQLYCDAGASAVK